MSRRRDPRPEPEPKPEDKEVLDEYYRYMLEERKAVDQAATDATKSFDQYMITLSGGALGLSLLYVEKVVPSPAPGSYVWMAVAWSCFAGALVVILASFYSTYHAWARQREILDSDIRKRLGQAEPESVPAWIGERSNPWDCATKTFNLVALILFTAGVVTLVTFAVVNFHPNGGRGHVRESNETGRQGGDQGAPGASVAPPTARAASPGPEAR